MKSPFDTEKTATVEYFDSSAVVTTAHSVRVEPILYFELARRREIDALATLLLAAK